MSDVDLYLTVRDKFQKLRS